MDFVFDFLIDQQTSHSSLEFQSSIMDIMNSPVVNGNTNSCEFKNPRKIFAIKPAQYKTLNIDSHTLLDDFSKVNDNQIQQQREYPTNPNQA